MSDRRAAPSTHPEAENPPPPGIDHEQALRLASDVAGSLVEKLGIEWIELGQRRAVARMPVAGNTQPYGLLHGGATAALCETVASVATAAMVGIDKLAVGVDLNITHLRAVREGHVTATGEPVRIGRTVAVWEMRVRDDAGELVAISRLTLAVRDPSAKTS
jgi:uncharacterized protein (TIGR00369 family)